MNRPAKHVLAVHNGVEKAIVLLLLAVLMVCVLWVACLFGFDLLSLIAKRMITGHPIDLEAFKEGAARMRVLHDVFGGFLLILIGVELMKTIAMYLSSHEVHVEVVFTVAIIAVTRHVIDLDLKSMGAMEMLGLGALVSALAVGYYFYRKAAAQGQPGSGGPQPEPPRQETRGEGSPQKGPQGRSSPRRPSYKSGPYGTT